MRGPFIIYAGLKSLLEKMIPYHKNSEKSPAIKTNELMPSIYSLFAHCSFATTKNKLRCYRRKDCMERFCKDLKEHSTKIIIKKKEIIPLTAEENKSYKKKKVCCICKKGFSTYDYNKKHHKVRDHCLYTGNYRGASHDICTLTYKTLKESPIVLYNGSTHVIL